MTGYGDKVCIENVHVALAHKQTQTMRKQPCSEHISYRFDKLSKYTVWRDMRAQQPF